MKSSQSLLAPQILLDDIISLNVDFFDFFGEKQSGVIEVHNSIQNDIQELFRLIFKLQFPIHSVKPISEYNFSDDDSMNANNTSAFNFRTVAMDPTRISHHGYGVAIDINPMQNPYIKGNTVLPSRGVYNVNQLGTLYDNHPIVIFMKERGFVWGGDWEKPYVDYQHFEKSLPEDIKEKYQKVINTVLNK